MRKKVKFFCPWTSSELITKRVISQFLTSEEDFKTIEIVYDDSYDIAVCFNHINVPIEKDKKYFIFPQEPDWNGSHQKNLQDNITIFGFDKSKYTGGICIESPMYAFYGGIGPNTDGLDVWNYSNIINTNYVKDKNISCSITVLNSNNGPSCIYSKRYKLLNSLLNEPYIDLYGCSSLLEKGSNVKSNSKKIDFVAPYKFSLTIENTHSKNYLTEKFYDAILTDCIPIYYGVNNLKELFPEDGYILIEDIDDIDRIKKLLKEVYQNADNIYKQKIEGAKKIKQRFFKEYNILKKVSESCNF